MRRLFTFGCSFTGYYYPTWADLLALNYDYSENWGLIGTGTRAAVERLAECHARNKIGANDTVVIQWSLHHRHDYHNPLSDYRTYPINWKTCGNIFSPGNSDVFTWDWIQRFWFEPSYVMHSLNHMMLAQGLLASTGCEYHFTSIGSWPLLNSDIEANSEGHQLADIEQLRFYIKPLFEDIPWLKPIKPLADERPHWGWRFWEEAALHPSPRQYDYWLKQSLSQLARVDTEPWLALLDQVYLSSDNDMLKFRQLLSQQPYAHWPYQPFGL